MHLKWNESGIGEQRPEWKAFKMEECDDAMPPRFSSSRMKQNTIAVADAALADLPNILARKVIERIAHHFLHLVYRTPRTSHCPPPALPHAAPELPDATRGALAQRTRLLPHGNIVSLDVFIETVCERARNCIFAVVQGGVAG
jgi:hypothetical protein